MECSAGAEGGMPVGHQRTTQTRGVWLWSRPIPVKQNITSVHRGSSRLTPGSPNTQSVSLIFFDTEGFESTGQSDAYDDRIFAFAAIMSSTLIYNLAEAVRESDIEKLAFAVELAAAFYPRYNGTEYVLLVCKEEGGEECVALQTTRLRCSSS